MASVTLDALYLHEANDNATFVTADLTGESETMSKDGQVRRYAGGRLRSITRAGSFQELDVELELADRADVDTIRGWAEDGTLLLYREPRGRKLWGVLYELNVDERPASSDFADASFTFRQVTYDESA